MKNIQLIKDLVGNVTADDLRYVDCAVEKDLGIFVPSTGFCQYAIKPNHTHPTYMFNIFLTSEHNIIKPKVPVTENEYLACVLSPNIPHVENNDGEFTRYYAVMIDSVYFDKIYQAYEKDKAPEYFWHQFTVSEELIFYLKEFMIEYQSDNVNSAAVLHNLAELVTHQLVRSLLKGEQSQKMKSTYEMKQKHAGIEKAIEYMQQNFGRSISVQDLCEKANLSQSHLDRLFRRDYDCSPKQYLNRLRIEKAKVYLKLKEESMTDIALKCGYSSASHFASAFKRETGSTPSNYQSCYELHNV